tara:strand:- start:620 stop:1237 length:618 start_codon:yes stop_codon:yes gene_type:complete
MDAKICGIKNSKTLNYLINHKYPPKFIGFICNYPKSKRYLEFKFLKKLIDINKSSEINFVSVLVNPNKDILNKIKSLNFDYLQLYDVSPERTLKIKKELNIKIISAITVKSTKDVNLYKKYKDISDIILFDSKGYEKSESFNHDLIKKVTSKIKIMLAGNIQYDDKLEKYRKITDIIDLSGSLETKGEKDVSKINIFLNNLKKIK